MCFGSAERRAAELKAELPSANRYPRRTDVLTHRRTEYQRSGLVC